MKEQTLGWPAALTGMETFRWARPAVHRLLGRLSEGRLTLVDSSGPPVSFGPGGKDRGLDVTVHVRNPRLYGRLLTGGSIGAAESYMDGDWTADDLVKLMRLFVRNKPVMDGLETGFAKVAAQAQRLAHALRRNTQAGSRRNIAAHYDLGNDFFSLFLDETMMYSCAIFPSPETSLRAASTAKNDRICRKLDLKPSDHLLEIGTGWGGFAIHAARLYGCRVTTTTISARQHEFASERVRRAGLSDRVTVLLEDYRDLKGQFDSLVSIEMVEAVGHQYLDTYTRRCASLLRPDGLMLLQSITIDDREYERARDEVDFIKRYIFPGSFIPSVTVLAESFRRSGGLRPVHLEDIGPHYALTLRHWRERFLASLPGVKRLGYPPEFVRMWEYYLALCEGGFEERYLGNVQMLLAKPDNRRTPYLPDLGQ